MVDPNGSSWDRFQAFLERLQPGDEVDVALISGQTGLAPEMCEHVLEALVRVDLFTRVSSGVFLRRRLFEALQSV